MKKRSKVYSLLAASSIILALPGLAFADNAADVSADTPTKMTADDNALRLWYKEPVPDKRAGLPDWENRALVQGNGSTGLMAMGKPSIEQIHFNEKTLWRGGPGSTSGEYIGGNRATGITPEALEAYRQKLDDKSEYVFGGDPRAMNSELTRLMFGSSAGAGGMGQYQDFGDIFLDFAASGITEVSSENYVRDLNLNTAVSHVDFDNNDVHFAREYFVSYPDNVAVGRFTASEEGSISFTASLVAAADQQSTVVADEAHNRLMLSTVVNNNGMNGEMQLRLINEGGTVTSSDGKTLTVENADSVVLVYSTGTDYVNEYPTYRGNDQKLEVTTNVDAAVTKGYESLLADHLADYQELFSRVNIDLGGEIPDIPTDALMAAYRGGDYATVVEEMAFQFGRYLLIAGSRTGDLPTNLLGLWMIGSAGTYWGADFHFNVNVQMNYWPAMITNLAETQVPFNEFVESLVVPGRLTADRSAAVKTENFDSTPIGEGNGFLINTQVNPFGHTAPIGSQEYGWNIGGSSWALQNIYDYYLFTGDTDFLRDSAYPMLKEMASFWNDYLWYSPYQDRLTVAPSVSAEQGPTAVGTAYDQSLVWELYNMAIKASETLGVDEDLRAVWKDKQSQLDPITIGEEGQVKEWFEETTLGKAKAGDLEEVSIWNFGAGGSANQGSVHRHTSQLVGLFPGTLINKDTPDWMDAAIKSLEQRSLNGTGWSKAMKINMYARTGLADDTYEMVRAMCGGNTNGLLDNLLDSHPPFQIDGNYGLTAGMAEMLIQSQLGYTQFLPALPSHWPTGQVEGLVARGNFVIDMSWEDGVASEFQVESRNGGTFVGEYSDISDAVVKDSSGTKVSVESVGSDRISFDTVAGEKYTIFLDEESDGSPEVMTATRCVAGKVVLVTTIQNPGTEPINVAVKTPYGEKTNVAVAGGKAVSQAFSTRLSSIPAGEAIVQIDDAEEPLSVLFAEADCG